MERVVQEERTRAEKDHEKEYNTNASFFNPFFVSLLLFDSDCFTTTTTSRSDAGEQRSTTVGVAPQHDGWFLKNSFIIFMHEKIERNE